MNHTGISEKVAIIADIHGNAPALSAVLADIRQADCSKMFVLGDIVNGVDPSGCIELLQTWRHGIEYLKGNAEFYVLTPELAAFPRRAEPMYAELIRLIQWFRSHLSATQLAWLQSFPDIIRWQGACLAHDSPLDRLYPERHKVAGIADQYQELCYHAHGITPEMGDEERESLLNWMGSQSVSQVFCGHTHRPFCRTIGRALICNVGSIGMPLDGDPRPSWVMVEVMPDGDSDVTIRRVTYDLDGIRRIIDDIPDYPMFERPAMRDAYKRMLQTGVHWRAYISE